MVFLLYIYIYTRTPTRLHYPAHFRARVKICAIGKKNVMKLEVFIYGGQRTRIEKRKKGWWRGRKERIVKGGRERIEKRQEGPELTI